MLRSRYRTLVLPVLALLLVTGLSGTSLAATHYVRPGDTLYGIARGWDVNLQSLIYTNGVSRNEIYPGQPLYIPNTVQSPDYSDLQKKLQQYVDGKPGMTYGIYFEDLATGKSAGVNPDTWIPAASTIKVPVILYLNSLAAQGKIDWQAKIAYNKKIDWQDGAGLLQFAARDGDTYSLRVLANLAITTSDNIAYRMLRRYLGLDNIISFMKGLGGNTVWPNGDNISTARDMATYMKATLNFQRDYPEFGRRLLDDMANAIYDVGLPGKLPDSVTVAHKEGDVSGVQNDVGIVFGSRPYVLTIMSQGNDDPDKGFGYIAEISRLVYDYQEWVAKWA